MKKSRLLLAACLIALVSIGCSVSSADTPKRFIIVHQESVGYIDKITVFKDLKTGECFLATRDGYSGGVTKVNVNSCE